MRPSSKCSGVLVGLILLHFQFWYLLGALKNIIIGAHNINVMGSAKGSVMRPVMLLIMKSGMGLAKWPWGRSLSQSLMGSIMRSAMGSVMTSVTITELVKGSVLGLVSTRHEVSRIAQPKF